MGKPSRGALTQAWLAGSALGLLDASWRILRQAVSTPAAAAWLLLWAVAGYTVLLAAALGLDALRSRASRERRPLGAGSLALGVALFLFLTSRIQDPGLGRLALAAAAAVAAGAAAKGTAALGGRLPLASHSEGGARFAVGAVLGAEALALAALAMRFPETRLPGLIGATGLAATVLAALAYRGSRARGLVMGGASLAAFALLLPCLGEGALAAAHPARWISGRQGRAAGAANGKEVRPNLLLVTIDTLRADRLGCYGWKRAWTPNLDALARESVLFEAAVAPYPKTGPSHATLLTGLYPPHHGVLHNGHPLRADVETLATRLHRRGYRTAAFVSGWTLKRQAVHLDRGFERFDEEFGRRSWFPEAVPGLLPWSAAAVLVPALRVVGPNERPAAATRRAAVAWLRHASSPFFLWVHFFDPHAPYQPPPAFGRRHDPHYTGGVDWYKLDLAEREAIARDPRAVEAMRAAYDGEISYVDAELGRLLAELRRRGEFERSVVVVTADHGESLGEHDHYFDHDDLHWVTLHVPLLIRLPQAAGAGGTDAARTGTRIAAPVGLVDVAPTLFEVLRLPVPKGLDGRSLAPALRGERLAPRPLFSFLLGAYRVGPWLAVQSGADRLILHGAGWLSRWRFAPYEELFDVMEDPEETRDRSSERPDRVAALRRLAARWSEAVPAASAALDPAVRARLRALGYGQ